MSESEATMSDLYAEQGWRDHTRSAVEYVTIIDSELIILFNNFTQPGIPDPVGVSCLTFVPPNYHDHFRGAVEKAFATGLPQHFETQADGPSGETSFYSGWANRITWTDGTEHVALVGTDITHLKRIEKQLEISDETLRSLVANAPDYIAVIDRQHQITFINRVPEGVNFADIVGTEVEQYLPVEDRVFAHALIERVFDNGSNETYDTSLGNADPAVHFSSRLSPVYIMGEVVGVTLIATDITDQNHAREALRLSEKKLQQSQRLRAVGQLTGGIAHDFNNLLTVIIGNIELAGLQRHDVDKSHQFLTHARRAADRASALTQRLLAFARKQALTPQTVHLAGLADETAQLLRRTLGPQVHVRIEGEAAAGAVHADRAQLENAVLNLAINARDAMGSKGGALLLRLGRVQVDEANSAALEDLAPGTYFTLAVSDDGPGMDAETLRRAFEPFYTTKGVGHGSGLGLSMVYGFAKQSHGHVTLHSRLGAGCTACLYLPPALDELAPKAPDILPATPVDGAGRMVLLVEDERAVASIAVSYLERRGFEVVLAEEADAALKALEAHPDIVLLFTDVGLPGGMNGIDLARRVREERPELPVLFTTGFDHGLLATWDSAGSSPQVLPKPFAMDDLDRALRALFVT